jgi:HPt (histidine-containing phosphotransfer) domain-containing protein
MKRFSEIAGGRPEGVVELIGLYLMRTTDQMNKLKEGLRDGRAEDVRRIAHSCAGSSGTCGVDGMVAPLRMLERMGASGQIANAGPVLEQAANEFERARQFLAAYQSR